MNVYQEYPGTSEHKKLLHAIVSYYHNDPRILAVILFGSLGRGNWDRYSDLDLDIVLVDNVEIDVIEELTLLCKSFTAIDEQAALIIPDHDDAGDIVLFSLRELSIRYHPLATTSPNIIDSMQILYGRIDRATIYVAGLANRREQDKSLAHLLNMCIRYAVRVNVDLHRQRLWGAIEALHRMRELLMELFAQSHGGQRSLQAFQAEANRSLQDRLGATLPRYSLRSAQRALLKLLDFLEQNLEQLTVGRVRLTEVQRTLLKQIREKQAEIPRRSGRLGKLRREGTLAQVHLLDQAETRDGL